MDPAQNDSIEIVRRMFEAFLAGADERALQFLHPDVQYDTTVRPDGKVWSGRPAVRRAMAEWIEAWEGYEIGVERYLPAGPDRVVMLWRESGRARSSGVPQAQSGATVFTVRDGQIVEMVPTLDRAAALAALGIGET